MNRIFTIFGILTLGMLFGNCGGDDSSDVATARTHADVYADDLVKIEDYLKGAYVEVERNANGDVTNVIIDTLNPEHTVSIWDQTEYPLQSKIVKLYGVDFKVYFLKLDHKGDTDADGDKPCGVDRVLTSYWGKALLKETKKLPTPHEVFSTPVFDLNPNPVSFNLESVVKGWEYMFPEFRAGNFGPQNSDGTLNPINYGSGVMFLPSGLGYFSQGFGTIPSYTPLVFAFNLYAVTRLDQDGDKIESRYEYAFDENGKLLDADSDGYSNAFDADDDNDGYLTRKEIEYTIGANTYYYPYNGAAVDDPATPFDETKGIPACGNTDFTSPGRKRKHVDSSCH